jgi:hypothetical protein
MPNLSASSVEGVIPFMAGILCILIGYTKTVVSAPPEGVKRFLRWAGPALLAFGVFLFISGCESRSSDTETLASAIKAKMKLPARVDDDTQLDDVRAISKTELGYLLTLTRMTKSQLASSPIASKLESNLRGGACQNADYAKFFKQGISLRITYQTQDQAEITHIILGPKDCGF